jgi:hypothetical protein
MELRQSLSLKRTCFTIVKREYPLLCNYLSDQLKTKIVYGAMVFEHKQEYVR